MPTTTCFERKRLIAALKRRNVRFRQAEGHLRCFVNLQILLNLLHRQLLLQLLVPDWSCSESLRGFAEVGVALIKVDRHTRLRPELVGVLLKHLGALVQI